MERGKILSHLSKPTAFTFPSCLGALEAVGFTLCNGGVSPVLPSLGSLPVPGEERKAVHPAAAVGDVHRPFLSRQMTGLDVSGGAQDGHVCGTDTLMGTLPVVTAAPRGRCAASVPTELKKPISTGFPGRVN